MNPDIHGRPIAQRIDWLLERADAYSARYCDPENWLARERYLARHPTAIAAMKCMDGRINLPVATNTPLGIVQPFRNLGGIFDLGWPHLGEILAGYVEQRLREGRRVLLLITYHFSRGDPRRGCAGFGCDTAAAHAHTQRIKTQVEKIFGRGHDSVYPVICGFETDEEALLLHGQGAPLDLATWQGLPDAAAETNSQLHAALAMLYPDMPAEVRNDFLPLLSGNLAHIAALRQQPRTLEIEHREWMICLGRGFDFLHVPNHALIIGPYSPDLAEPIRKAAHIIARNMSSGRIPADGLLLLTSVPYEHPGMERARAELKSCFMGEFAARVIQAEYPALANKMHQRTAVLDWRSRRLEMLGAPPGGAELPA